MLLSGPLLVIFQKVVETPNACVNSLEVKALHFLLMNCTVLSLISFFKNTGLPFFVYMLYKKYYFAALRFVSKYWCFPLLFCKLFFCRHGECNSKKARFYKRFKKPKKKVLGYLVDPASGICLSQGLSHASLSMSEIVQRNCEWLGKTAIVSSMVY